MDAATLLLLIRGFGELIEGIPELLKILERAASGEEIPNEEIKAAIERTIAKKEKWDDSVARAAERGAAGISPNTTGENVTVGGIDPNE